MEIKTLIKAELEKILNNVEKEQGFIEFLNTIQFKYNFNDAKDKFLAYFDELVSKGLGNVKPVDNEKLAKMIDHTLLKPEAKNDDVVKLCDEAKKYNTMSVCVNPTNISLAYEQLKNSDVKVCTVIGFPLGANTKELKAFETEDAIKNGASEVDMVLNIGKLKSKDYQYVYEDLKAVADVATKHDVLSKVILETCLLTDEEKVIACMLSVMAGLDFVKTSTGFNTGGATAYDIALMRTIVGDEIGVKASGGVRTRNDAETMIAFGANRIGASATVNIISNQSGTTSGY
ncbi:MAG TPA: deoxyribose-phosphate aldolase [Ignavibacteriales bacterium]|nr:deoxyribose-phosphate aldolase [Ignavibacteriales bacterium]HPD67040.1 deoxyribose-phosphate aldolase [Ignavibacteriales bacterium]HRR19476.1 deoxyribose-phosphate aldolase [Ignavibacteriales bacterium]HRT99812.1 deoxyribose-phosphate aldolase [Ignavibacteriales bacterium]